MCTVVAGAGGQVGVCVTVCACLRYRNDHESATADTRFLWLGSPRPNLRRPQPNPPPRSITAHALVHGFHGFVRPGPLPALPFAHILDSLRAWGAIGP